MKFFIKFLIAKANKTLIVLSKILPLSLRIKLSLIKRPSYAYCIYHAAILARKLGLNSMSVIEFGVASGNGLREIEIIVKKIEKLFGLKIEIYGFDTGEGLPEPIDYRDLPYHWKSGFFKMDYEKLKKVLNKSNLIIGDINKTSKTFFKDYSPAPIGAIFHDFDYYSSTKESLNLLKSNPNNFLPRVFNYFDDTVGSEMELYNDYTGQRLAINEFNQENDNMKFSYSYHLISKYFKFDWHYKIWITHIFNHDLYSNFISHENQQINMD